MRREFDMGKEVRLQSDRAVAKRVIATFARSQYGTRLGSTAWGEGSKCHCLID